MCQVKLGFLWIGLHFVTIMYKEEDIDEGEAESHEESGGAVFQHFFNRFRRIVIKICNWCCYNICVVIFMLLLVALIVNAHTN